LQRPSSFLTHQAVKETATAAEFLLQDGFSGSSGPIADHARESARALKSPSAHAGLDHRGTKVASSLSLRTDSRPDAALLARACCPLLQGTTKLKTLESILFATDFTAASREALKSVIRLAGIFGSEVHVLHIIEPLQHFRNAALETLHTRYERQRTQELLLTLEKEMTDNGVKLRGCLEVSGAVSESIVSAASRVSADLIVLGAGSLTSSRAIGVTSQAVMEHAEQPVLVIHPNSSSPEFHTILCPVDHSSVSRRGLRNAIFLARMLQAQLIWLSVIPEVSWLTAAAEIGEITNVKAEYEAQWCEELDRFTASVDFEGVAHTLVLERGVPHEQIIAVAQKHAADLIVMGATGRSGLLGVLLGSTTRRVLRSLPCSLLTVRQQDVADQEE
jgi:nucleotide-binding universal stress UspA family protein